MVVLPIRFLLHGAMTEVVASGFYRRYQINCEVNFFRATGHVCEYTVVIPPLNEPIVTQDPVMIAEQIAHQNNDEVAEIMELYAYDLNHLSTPYLLLSKAKVFEPLTLQQLLTPSPLSSITNRYGAYLHDLVINSRVLPALYMPIKPFTALHPHARKVEASSSNIQSFFEKTVAKAHAKSSK
ncbi:hypothetical protein C0989_002044 [Termitomyces sp. Mn162]|nr:hypothetical protein C0989_002044 [Termitomyces sp. Mn162]